MNSHCNLHRSKSRRRRIQQLSPAVLCETQKEVKRDRQTRVVLQGREGQGDKVGESTELLVVQDVFRVSGVNYAYLYYPCGSALLSMICTLYLQMFAVRQQSIPFRVGSDDNVAANRTRMQERRPKAKTFKKNPPWA